MNRFDQYLTRLFLIGLPLAVLMGVGVYFFCPDCTRQDGTLNTLAGIFWGCWFLISFLFAIRILTSSIFQSTFIKKLARLKDQDERESALTGATLKTTFLSTIALLIFLLMWQTFHLSIDRLPPDQAINGKRGTITMGLNFALTDHKKEQLVEPQQESFFSFSGIPLSKEALLLLLILWNLGTYHFLIRRELNRNYDASPHG